MSDTWMTKWGPRRVRYEPPTLVEALDAASDLSPDQQQQIQLAAELMNVAVADVTEEAEAIFKSRSRRRITATITQAQSSHGQPRAPIVVEHRAPRRIVRAVAER
jgi:hypothetical protein